MALTSHHVNIVPRYYRNTKPLSTYQARKQTSSLEPLTIVGPDWQWAITPNERWSNAIARARAYGHRVWREGVDGRRWKVCSHGEPGDVHLIFMSPAAGPVCDCRGFQYGSGICWHVAALYLRLLRESRPLRLRDMQPTEGELLED